MVKYENRCVGCAVPAYPCRGASCPNRNVPVHYCDNCGKEIINAQTDGVNCAYGVELCEDCYKEVEEE